MEQQNHPSRVSKRREKLEAKRQKRRKKNSLLKKIMISLGIIMLITMIAGAATLFAIIKRAPELDPEKLIFSQPSILYDENDEQFAQLVASENRIRVSIHDVPQLLEDAFIAVEDVRFREHNGIDIRRMFGALIANVKDGFGAEGASTITQQVVKNAFLTFDKTIERKIQEQYLAIKLEQKYSKDEILEMYLNAIYFGNGAYGVKQASIVYFNKEDLNDLTLADCALLAGLPQRPEGYNPLRNPEGALKRRNIVLDLMAKHGKITKKEAEEAKAVPIEEQLNPAPIKESPHQAFIDQVLSEVEAMDGITPNDLYTAGLKIYTTVDLKAQEIVERVLQTDEIISTYPDNPDFEAGVTVIDTKTGEIKAIGGGRQKQEAKRAFNYATDIKRQPGSTIKPILDYGPAIEYLLWSTGHILVDEPHTYSNGTPLYNYNRTYRGPVTMREALRDSLNIPAIKALQAVGLERAQKFAEDLGIPFDDGPMTEAYGIGGFRTGISTLHLAGAFAAFGNEGIYTKPHTVRKIEFPDGKVIDTKPKSKVVMNDYTAYMITDMLKTVVQSGTGQSAAIPGLPIAGKTGTTNFEDSDKRRYGIPEGGVPDVWFAGYTTNYSIAVWTGYERMGEGNYLIGNSTGLARRIFREIMSRISEGKVTQDFKQPPSVVRIAIDKRTGLLPTESTPQSNIVYELFVKGTEPTQYTDIEDEIPAPADFMGSYNEATDQIILSWSYPNEEIASFRLTHYSPDGSVETISLNNTYQHIISGPINGTHRFELVAIADDNESKPAQIQVTVNKGTEPEIPDPIDEIPEEPVEPPANQEPADGNGNTSPEPPDETPPNDHNESPLPPPSPSPQPLPPPSPSPQ